MKSFKLTILFTVVSLLSLQGFAQQKKSTNVKRAETQTAYIVKKMDLNESQSAFIYDVLVKKFKMNTDQIKGKELSQEEKRAIYQATNKKIQAMLGEKFSKEEIIRINKLQNEANKNVKKTKK